MNRRHLLATAMLAPLLLLAAHRALTALMREGGFYDDAIARISLPRAFGGERAGNVITAILLSQGVRDRLLHQANRAAEHGAELASPMIADVARTMPIGEALAVVRGSPSAATDLLKGRIGNSLIPTMLPGIDKGLRLFDSEIVTEALRLASGIDFAAFRDDVTAKAADSVFRAIAREEAAIRADPASTNDPLLIGVFGLAGRKL